jgi:predicted transcriptional regulator
MNARDYLDLRNYRMAVIESRTCIEVVIDQILETEFARRGTDIEEVKKILGVNNKKDVQIIEDVLENAWINNKLKKGLKYVLGQGLNEDIDLWQKWLKAKKNREKAVHKAIDISEADAENAVDTLSQIFDFIIKKHVK